MCFNETCRKSVYDNTSFLKWSKARRGFVVIALKYALAYSVRKVHEMLVELKLAGAHQLLR
jgi:hypothetical protein